MKKRKNSIILVLCFICMAAAVLFVSACSDHADDHDDHTGHDHGPAVSAETTNAPCDQHDHDHDDHGHVDDDDHAQEHPEHLDEHEGNYDDMPERALPGEVKAAAEPEIEVEIAPEAMKLAGITLAKAGIGRISRTIKLSGEVGFNEERLVRITPRFSGIVKETRFRKGDFVKAGDVVAVIDSNESMAPYALKAPFSGRIIEKQAVPGEYVSEEKSIYVLADLSTVWVNLAVYPKDADNVKPGQKLSIAAVGSDTSTEGTVSYVTPVIDVQTRTVNACVVVPNEDNAWRPGSFVHAHMEDGQAVEGLVVDKDAVQILDNTRVVFVQHEPGSFKPVEVITGENDSRNILIVSGLKDGDEYVSNGAFELKAKIVTSSLGDHAGHGH